ncbi:hypothetical protein [Xanthomarina sp. GH4-25]|uniref:hypothetical protein n=1 Tax=Xanthomarina sp. GH4-25 TaxID=3349335 RepID=UPI0038783241
MFGCQKEDDVNIESTINNVSIKEYTFNELNGNTKFSKSYKKVVDAIKKKRSNEGRSFDNNDFEIDSTVIKEIKIGNTTSYTFRAILDNQEPNSFSNIVVQTDSLEGIKAMLITYFPESPMEYIEAHNSYTFQGTSVFEAIEIDSSFIENKYIDGCVENYTSSWGGTDHPAGGNCTAAYITVDWTCANSGGGGSGSSSSGSGNSPSNNPDPILTAPTYNFPYEQNLIGCLETDNLAILEWINNSANFFQMRDASKLCNADNQGFIIEGIETELEGGEADFPNRVILDSTFVNNVQLKCVYDKLTADNNTLFKNTVGAFVNDPNFYLTFRVGECTLTDDQCTNDSDPNNIVITFEDVNTSPVEMAQAILHESIHAELARFVEQYLSGVDINNRPQLFQYYTYYAELYGEFDDAIDHIFMTQNYINPITQALREFDNNSYPLEYYKSFSWDGLRKWDAGNLLDIDPLADEYDVYRVIVNQNTTICN